MNTLSLFIDMAKISAITPTHLSNALTYEAYMALSEELFSQHRTTSDDPYFNSEKVLHLTRLNLHRINRLERNTIIPESLTEAVKAVSKRWIWVVLAESWCGDVAQNLPVIQLIAAKNPNIEIRILLRDKNPEVMDAYLTNGTRSIPKLICISADDFTELGTWGPRPTPLQALLLELKKQQVSHDEAIEQVHAWYAKDKSQHLLSEFFGLINQWKSVDKAQIL